MIDGVISMASVDKMLREVVTVNTRVNGKDYSRVVEARTLASDFIRDELRLTGTHVGCEHGVCGVCTVLLDGVPVRSCLMFAPQLAGHEVTTIEGLTSTPDDLESWHPLQKAFRACGALQCGFCTPGILTTMIEFLNKNTEPSREEVREALSGNLCRCTGYVHIIDAVMQAAEELRVTRAGA